MQLEPHMIIGQTGHASFPEHSGKVVFPTFWDNFIVEEDGVTKLVKLFSVTPTLHSAAGNVILWQQKHLLPIADFPKEELLNAEIEHFLRTL